MRNLILQIWMGKSLPEYAEISSKMFRDYATFCNAEYKLVRIDGKESFLHGTQSIHLFYKDERFDAYDDILVVDMDVVPAVYSNIFELDYEEVLAVPSHEYEGMHPGYFPVTIDENSIYTREVTARYKHYGVDNPPKSYLHPEMFRREVNSGVMVWTRAARQKARAKFPPVEEWINLGGSIGTQCDQPFFNVMFAVHNFNVTEATHEWNQNPIRMDPAFKPDKQIIFEHYHGNKTKLMMADKYRSKV